MFTKNASRGLLFVLSALFLTLSCTPHSEKVRKAVFIIVDGIPADVYERVEMPATREIAAAGSYGRQYVGGSVGRYDESPTISAVGYTDLLTATWVNKHNVPGNHHLNPNYNYWTVFRIAKEQDRPVRTGLFSSWTDNRTVLLGAGKPETDSLVIDYVADGYDLDRDRFPDRSHGLRVWDIDETVSKEAASCIRTEAPDLSWVYLWYTDVAGHNYGSGEAFDDAVRLADKQVERIWEAVKYRESHFNEEWMVVVTTDHGRTYDGYGHGGQSLRERTTWVATNQKANERLSGGKSAITDITPSLCRFLGFTIPRDLRFEQDGVSFYGTVDLQELDVFPYDSTVVLKWEAIRKDAPVEIWASATNHFKDGGKDDWINVGQARSGDESFTVNLSNLPESDFFKFVVETPHTTLNRWLYSKPKEYAHFKLLEGLDD